VVWEALRGGGGMRAIAGGLGVGFGETIERYYKGVAEGEVTEG
jgi:hypothetical protein